jgi:hypothetical protein
VSEYQYYEFIAVDRPLDDDEQAEVRSLSTRAEITATRFVNEYHWGDFRGEPNVLMEHYYDAHLYLANWGTHRIMLRLPLSLLDPDVVEDYCVGDHVSAWTTGNSVVLDLTSDDEPGDWETPEGTLSAIIGVRDELTEGDLRPLYLAWLAGYGTWERDEDAFDYDHEHEPEPPVPAGLATLTGPQRALADFLRLDDDLLAVAAETSPPLNQTPNDRGQLATWVNNLPMVEKNRLLVRIVEDRTAAVRMELLRRFRDEHTTNTPAQPRRTVADLLDNTARRRADHGPREAAHASSNTSTSQASTSP